MFEEAQTDLQNYANLFAHYFHHLEAQQTFVFGERHEDSADYLATISLN